jgi:hypothetical protein
MRLGTLLSPVRPVPATDDTFARIVAQLDRENAVVLARAAADEKRRAQEIERRHKIAAHAAELGNDDE